MEKVVRLFWKYINDADFYKLNGVLTNDVCVWLPNTREVFKGKEKYIEFNAKYPDRWYANLEKLYVCEQTVISVTKIFNGSIESFYVTSIFRIKNNLIEEITEYWGENEEPPAWRGEEKLSERY